MAVDQSPWKDVSELMKRSRDAAYTHSPYKSSQAPWTATRCLRLLRPISSKICTLEKLRRNGENVEDDDLFYDSENDGRIANQAVQAHREYLDESWDFEERPRKKVKRTYSSRQRNGVERTASKHHKEQDGVGGAGPWKTHQGANDVQTYGPNKIGGEVANNVKYDSLEQLFDVPYNQEAFSIYQRTTAKHIAETTGIAQSKKKTTSNSNERFNLCKGITGSVSALLKATNGTIGKRGIGASSLYAMCLKRMPRFIAEEEHFTRIEKPDSDQDVISDIYTYLENQAISDSWKPLRTIVRAHGIQHICAAIDQSILSIGMALEMVQVCLREKACDEAATIMHYMMRAFLQKLEKTSEPARSRDQSQILGGFLKIASQVEDEGHAIRLLSKVVRLPFALAACAPILINPTASAMSAVGYIGSDRLAEASILLRALNKASICRDIDDVASNTTAIRKTSWLHSRRPARRERAPHHYAEQYLCDRGSDRNQAPRYAASTDAGYPPGISSMMIHITGVVLSYQDRCKEDESLNYADLEHLIEALAQDTRQIHETCDAIQKSVRQRQAMATVLWARAMSRLSATHTFDNEACSKFGEVFALAEMDLQNTEISLLGLFTFRVVEFCEQLNSAIAFDMLKSLMDSATQLIMRSSCGPRNRSLLQKLAVSSAFAFCEASKQPCHLEWALGIEEKIFGKDCLSPERSTLRTPARAVGKPRIGYRWEEGICEWITRTPVSTISQLKPVSVEAGETIDELDDTTLVEAWPMKLLVDSEPQKSASNGKRNAPQTALTKSSKCDGTDSLDVVSICVTELDGHISSSDNSFDATLENTTGAKASTMQQNDEIDELCEDWCSQPSTQSSFQESQSQNQPIRCRWSRAGRRTKGHSHRLLPKAVGRSLAALFDKDDQSSDMEDELGM